MRPETSAGAAGRTPWVLVALAASMSWSAAVARAQPAPWPPEGGVVVDRVVAVVNAEPITAFEVERATAPMVMQMQQQGQVPDRAALVRLRAEVLGSLINDVLIRDEARKLGLTVTQEQVDAQMQRVKDANSWSDDQLAIAIRGLGFESISDYRKHAEREMLKSQAVGIRVGSKIKVDEAEVQQVFQDEFGGGARVEERRAAHILLRLGQVVPREEEQAVVERLQAVRGRIEAGETTFEEAAREVSQDSNASAGGDLGFHSKGNLDPTFEAEVWRLSPGEISAPVRTQYGYHLIKLLDARTETTQDPEKQEALLRQIRYRLRERELERLYDVWVEDLRKDAYVEVKKPRKEDPRWKATAP